MLNHSVLMGRMTRDPELKRTQTGIPVCSFTLAVERDYTSADGDKETDFIDFVAWRGVAEIVSRYFSKGRMTVVEGRLQTRLWTDKAGSKRKATEIVAERVYFGDAKRDDNDGYGYTVPEYQAPAYTPDEPTYSNDFRPLEDEDDVPF